MSNEYRKYEVVDCIFRRIFDVLSIEVPAVVVGVVGMGHVHGIERNWERQLNIEEIMRFVRFVLWILLILGKKSVIVFGFTIPQLFLIACVFLSVAPPSQFSWVIRTIVKGIIMGMLGYACYRAGGSLGRSLLSLPAVQSLLETLRPPPAWTHSSFLSHHWHDFWSIKTMHLSPVALKTVGEAGRTGWPAHNLNFLYKDFTEVKRPSPSLDALIDKVWIHCQRNHDSTFAYIIQILHFVKSTGYI